MLKYALICGHLEQYQAGTVKEIVSPHDNKTPLLEWTDARGNHCVGDPAYFVSGELEDLQKIIRDTQKKTEEHMKEVLSYFPDADAEHQMVIRLLAGDGFSLEELLEDDGYLIEDTLEGINRYLEWNGDVVSAYMDYMH